MILNDEKMDSAWSWVIVLGNLHIAAMFGTALRCYSVFYIPLMEEYNVDYSTVAWLSGSYQMAYGIGSMCSSAFFKILGIRKSVMTAGVAMSLACTTAFFCKELWQIQLLVGTVCGFASGPMFLGACTILTRYFKARLHTAMQIMCVGMSLGPFVTSPLYQYFIDTFGWRGSLLIVAGIHLNVAVSGSLLRPRKPIPNSITTMEHSGTTLIHHKISNNRKILLKSKTSFSIEKIKHRPSSVANCLADKLDFVIFKKLVFFVYVITWSLLSAGYISTMMYLIPYSKQTSLISALSVGEVVSKPFLGILLDRIHRNKRLTVVAPLLGLIGIQIIFIPHLSSYPLMVTVCALIGLCGGGMDGAFATFIADMFGLELYSSAYGYSNAIIHCIGMGATLMLGWIVDSSNSFEKAFHIGGTLTFFSMVAAFGMNYLLVKEKTRG